MRTITITTVKKEEIPEKKKYQRSASYKRLVEAIELFNKDCDKFLNKTIEIKRINQAVSVYTYAGATGPGTPPYYYLSRVSSDGVLSLTVGYSSEDTLRIVE